MFTCGLQAQKCMRGCPSEGGGACPAGTEYCTYTEQCAPIGSCRPTCGPGELYCARTNECDPKTQPSSCWECTSNAQCGDSAFCIDHECVEY